MTDLRSAAQQALEALRLNNDEWEALADSGDCGRWTAESQDHYKQTNAAIAALEAALAQQDEPCPNCASLEAQNTELDRKLAELEQAKPVQEPVAWRHKGAGHFTTTPLVSMFPEWEPLYPAPPQRKPLTQEEIEQCFRDAGITINGPRWTNAVRNVERAHGIKE